MSQLFTSLTDAMSGSPALALAASFLWGMLSVLLSPCHLASIPLIVGFMEQQDGASSKRALWLSMLFASGILITIAVIGLITALVGRMLGDVGSFGNFLVAAVFLVVGLQLLGVVPSPWSKPDALTAQRVGSWSAFLLGLIFGVALGPCTFGFMAPMLGVTFKVASSAPMYAMLLLGVYGLGHCSVIVVAGAGANAVQRYLNWNSRSNGAILMRRSCGVLVILAGLYMIYISP